MSKISPKQKTIIATTFFSLVGICSALFTQMDMHISLPLIVFYAVITLNTYFSLKLFTRIVPHHSFIQHFVDALLFCLYVLLALTFAQPFLFAFIVTLLFAVATMKYTLLLGTLNHPRLLKRKITIDTLGTLMGIITLGGMLAGYMFLSSWFLAITFMIANIFLLFVRPMYRDDE